MLFIWHVLPGCFNFYIKRHIHEYLKGQFPESFGDRIIFMSVFNGIDWTKKGNTETCLHKAKEETAFATKFKPEHWCFLGPASESTLWNGHSSEPQGQLDVVALPMGDIFKCHTSHSDISSDRAMIAWTSGDLRKQFHFQGTFEKEILINTTLASYSLCIYHRICWWWELQKTKSKSITNSSNWLRKKQQTMQQARGDSLVQLTENHETMIRKFPNRQHMPERWLMDISTAPMNLFGMETALLLYAENTQNQEILWFRG